MSVKPAKAGIVGVQHVCKGRGSLLTWRPAREKLPGREEALPCPSPRGNTLASRQELSDFLAQVERRAYKQALFAVRDGEVALDLVQDAMLKLTEKYSGKPAQEFPMLFQRILQNATRDYFRRQKVRSLWSTLLSSLGAGKDDDDERDPLDTLEVESNDGVGATPQRQLEQKQVLTVIDAAIQKLPARQREAFLLRYWEELDVAETAQAMGCSEGSVKTHCSRAVQALSAALKAKGITL